MPHIKAKSLNPQHGTGYHASFLGIAGEALTANDIVIANGYSGNRIQFVKADANVDGLDSGVMGVADHGAASGASVRVVSHKLITSVDSSASEGVGYPVYLSNAPGGWSTASGGAPIVVGSVVTDHASTGAVLLAPAHCVQKAQAPGTMAAATGATTTLTAADSGKTVLLAPNNAHVVLPTPVAGLTFKIIQTGAYSTADNTVKTATVDNSVFFVGGHATSVTGTTNGNNSNNSSNDVITFGSGTLAGDYVELTCLSSTTWHAVGFANNASSGITFSDA